ncbi:hypothetical protein DFH09DRAFT_1073636 [Mycena vulgaris]|nr:hypothetical protein DFH09DRAFT_1073636 [Mycena vulgaris]
MLHENSHDPFENPRRGCEVFTGGKSRIGLVLARIIPDVRLKKQGLLLWDSQEDIVLKNLGYQQHKGMNHGRPFKYGALDTVNLKLRRPRPEEHSGKAYHGDDFFPGRVLVVPDDGKCTAHVDAEPGMKAHQFAVAVISQISMEENFMYTIGSRLAIACFAKQKSMRMWKGKPQWGSQVSASISLLFFGEKRKEEFLELFVDILRLRHSRCGLWVAVQSESKKELRPQYAVDQAWPHVDLKYRLPQQEELRPQYAVDQAWPRVDLNYQSPQKEDLRP